MDQQTSINILQLTKYLPNGITLDLTNTMLEKSTIDANKEIRDFFSNNDFFQFDNLQKGKTEYGQCQLLCDGIFEDKKISFVRPAAKPNKPGDPRFWIYDLKQQAHAGQTLYIAVKDSELFIIPVKPTKVFIDQIDQLFDPSIEYNQNYPVQDDNNLKYIVGSGLKNLIGKQLITDDFIAIFELVKNSFDAYAKNVKIQFSGIYSDKDSITISDDGKGMSFDDLKNKWLFVGYSAKKEGTEDLDYRKNLGVKRLYAGAKGVGRFSCDRLGRKLKLTTKKDSKNSNVEVLYTDWDKFEENIRAKFEDIGVTHETIPNYNFPLKHGTIIEITELNTSWTRDKFLKLKGSLEKLIIPGAGGLASDFNIEIIVDEELERDKEKKEYYEKVNGQVQNLIFENIGLKTTTINIEISSNGERILSELNDRGEPIYKITELNNRYNLKGISIKLFYLNQSTKMTFSTRMGIPMYKFGHVFVYKNGFRINPYGNYQEDGFGIDIRRAQKDFSRLGTRTIAGRIEINGENPGFIETTSRDGGFINNASFAELKKFYYDVLTRFENYVVKVIQWGTDIDTKDLIKSDQKDKIVELIKDLTDSENIVELWYNEKIFDILSAKQEKTAKGLLKNLQRLVENTGAIEFMDDIIQAQQRVDELEKITEQAEEIAKEAQVSVVEARNALEFEKQKNKYLESIDRSISDDARGLLHSVLDVTNKIHTRIEHITHKIKEGSLSPNFLLKNLSIIKYNSDKAVKLSRLITRSDFKGMNEKKTVDIASYLSEYLTEYSSMTDKEDLKFEINRNETSLYRKASLLDLSIIIDNLISNSVKAEADLIRVDFYNPKKDELHIEFSDNGKGLNDEFLKNPEIIFDLGITSTNGSGIGLNIVRDRLKDMDGEIHFKGNNIILIGATFLVKLF